jgi:hypothetical protein
MGGESPYQWCIISNVSVVYPSQQTLRNN